MKTGHLKDICSSNVNKKLFVKDGFQSIRNYVIILYAEMYEKKSRSFCSKYKTILIINLNILPIQ